MQLVPDDLFVTLRLDWPWASIQAMDLSAAVQELYRWCSYRYASQVHVPPVTSPVTSLTLGMCALGVESTGLVFADPAYPYLFATSQAVVIGVVHRWIASFMVLAASGCIREASIFMLPASEDFRRGPVVMNRLVWS